MASDRRRSRRRNIDLEMIGLRPGDVLTLVSDPEVTCMVVEPYPPRVIYKNHVVSLTVACNRAYGMDWNDPAAVWVFEGEALVERRQRFEDYHCDQ